MNNYQEEMEAYERLAQTQEAREALNGWGLPVGMVQETPFPVDCLPGDLAAFVRNAAEALQLHVDMVANFALGALSIPATGSYVQASDTFREPMQLYMCVIGQPCEGKSRAMKLLTSPSEEWLAEENQRREPDIASSRSLYNKARNSLQKLENSKDASDRDIREAAEQVTRSKREIVRPLAAFVKDSTTEAVETALAETGGTAFVVADEGETLKKIMGLNTKDGQSNVGVILNAYSGESVSSRRINREAVSVPHAHAAILIGTQPEVAMPFLQNETLQGNGLLSRFLFASPPSMIGSRRLLDVPPLSEPLKKAYAQKVRAMCHFLVEPAELHFDINAMNVLAAYYAEIERRISRGGDLANICNGWGGRCAGKALRIAGLFTLWDGEKVVTAKNMRAAIEVVRYYTNQALILCGYGGTLGQETAAFLEKIKTERWTAFYVKDLKSKMRGKGFYKNAKPKERDDLVRTGLRELVEDGYIRVGECNNADDFNPNTSYDVNPLLYEDAQAPAPLEGVL